MKLWAVEKYRGGKLYGDGHTRIFCKDGQPAGIMKWNEPTLSLLLEHMAPPPHSSPFAYILWLIVAEADKTKMEKAIQGLTVALRAANKNRRAALPMISRRIKKLYRDAAEAADKSLKVRRDAGEAIGEDDKDVEKINHFEAIKDMIAKDELSERYDNDTTLLHAVLELFDELGRPPTLAEIKRLKLPDWKLSEVRRVLDRVLA